MKKITERIFPHSSSDAEKPFLRRGEFGFEILLKKMQTVKKAKLIIGGSERELQRKLAGKLKLGAAVKDESSLGLICRKGSNTSTLFLKRSFPNC